MISLIGVLDWKTEIPKSRGPVSPYFSASNQSNGVKTWVM